MTGIDPTLREQLCAYLDGELPVDEARFLLRRLESDPELRAQWERWQLASACLRGQPVRTMPATLAPAIAQAIASPESREPRRRGPWPWLAAAAAAVLVAVLLPGRPVEEPGPASLAVQSPATIAPVDRPPVLPPELAPELAAETGDAMDMLTPISELPLADGGSKPWPRSPLATDEQQLEAYLVGHNTLMAEDGLGGFMPYVDVVAHDGEEFAAEGEP